MSKGRLRRLLRASTLAAVLLSGAFPAHSSAAEDFLSFSPEQLLSAEVVSVSKKAEPVARAPAAVYVITSEDIERSGVTSIADALRMAPGVDVAQGDSNSWAINIRGFNKGLANQLLVMIDGRTIYSPLFAGTYWEIQNLPLADVERIEVVRGPGGTLWGANAVNGVINIITKKAQDTQGNLVVAGMGNYQRDYVLGQNGGKTESGGYYRVYGQHFNNNSFQTPQGRDIGDAWHDSRAGFRFDQGDKLTISGDVYNNVTDQLTAVPQFTAPYSSIVSDNVHSFGANILAHWNNKFDDGSLLSLQSFLDYTVRDQFTLRDEEDIFDIEAQYNLRQIGPHEITLGGGYRMTRENSDNSPTLSFHPSVTMSSLSNIFVQDKITLVPDSLYLTLGSKAEHNSDTGLEFEPNARLQWFPDERQAVWLSVSKAVRTPSPLERNIDLNAGVFPPGALPWPTEFNLFANDGFKSERLIAYEAGYRNQITDAVSADAALFYNNYNGIAAQQLVGLSIVPNLVTPQYVLFQTNQDNLMFAETYGGELAMEWNVTDNWKLSGSYSLLKMALHLENDFTNLQAEEDQSPQQMANIRSYWNINKDWSLDTSAYYVDRLKAYDVPDYVRLDMNLGWHVGQSLQFNLVGQNLLDNAHREFGSETDINATEVPRAFFGKLTWRF